MAVLVSAPARGAEDCRSELYHVFSLSFRDVELLLAERGIGVTHESIRQCCIRFGADFARRLRRRRPRPGDTEAFRTWRQETCVRVTA